MEKVNKENAKPKAEVKKDEKYYEKRRQEGIRKVTAKKTEYQKKRTFERGMSKLKNNKPLVDPVVGVLWGTEK